MPMVYKNQLIQNQLKIHQILGHYRDARQHLEQLDSMMQFEPDKHFCWSDQNDSNQDKKITNGELLSYMNENVSQKAAELGREQNPSLSGDPDKVLISYR